MADALLSLPRASAYVIEAHAQRQITEAFISAILGRFPKGRFVVGAEKLAGSSAFPLLRQGVKGLLTCSEVPTGPALGEPLEQGDRKPISRVQKKGQVPCLQSLSQVRGCSVGRT